MTQQPIQSITSGPRQTNMEVLRMLAMLLVLMVHANFWALGEPNQAELFSKPFAVSLRVILESIAIICVNVFILISGWFGIKPTLKGFYNFLFQCAYFYFGINLVISILMGGGVILQIAFPEWSTIGL